MSIYQLIIKFYSSALRIASKFGHKKAKLFIDLRRDQKLKKFTQQHIWIHAASAGEGNQAIPIAKTLRDQYNYKVSISFFSPAGYLFHKDSNEFDQVLNLPLDKRSNVEDFIDQLNPNAAIFIKKELWLNTLNYLTKLKIKSFLVNASPNSLFKNDFLHSFHTNCLSKFEQIYLTKSSQLKVSSLLKVSNLFGDTKYESAFDIVGHIDDDIVSKFTNNSFSIIIGSSWPEEEKFIERFIESGFAKDVKIIIAPHEVDNNRILSLKNRFDKTATIYSNSTINYDAQILIVDQIGKLKSLYKYCDIAIVSGGLGKGIHNILEPIAYCKPVLFGSNYQKFDEAVELVETQLAFSYNDYENFKRQLLILMQENFRREISNKLKEYAFAKVSISEKIVANITSYLK